MAEKNTSKPPKDVSDNECFTIDEFATELGVSVERTRQLLAKAFEKRHVQDNSRKEKNGPAFLYPPSMVEQLKQLYLSGEYGKPRKRKGSDKKSKGDEIFVVALNDKEAARVLIGKFGSRENVIEYLKTQLEHVSKPTLQKVKELEAKFEKEKEALLRQG